MDSILVCTSNNVLLPDWNTPKPATLTIDTESGKITAIQPGRQLQDSFPNGVRWLDFGSKFILPGLVDAHVHLNEPGRTDWEGFATGTRAAASGGVTTVVDMPLNSLPPTVTVPNLELKRKSALGQCYTDVAFWGGVIPGNESHLKPLIDAGVRGFKCFLIDSGVEEFPCVSEIDLTKSMGILQESPTILLFHAELDSSDGLVNVSHLPSTEYSTFLQSRPSKLETDAITLIIQLQKRYPSLRCHIVHLSASDALPLIQAAKRSGVNLTVETCFHYLCLASDDVPHGHPEFKCCPPIRSHKNRERLWEALKSGLIDCVVSDHSPCVAELKNVEQGDIMSAWGGISTLGLGLSLLWTEAKRRGDVSIGDIMRWTSLKTAEHAGLSDFKGKLQVGYDADFIIWNPNSDFTVTKESLNFKNKLSPYVGRALHGRVEQTYLAGRLVYDSVQGFSKAAPGKLL